MRNRLSLFRQVKTWLTPTPLKWAWIEPFMLVFCVYNAVTNYQHRGFEAGALFTYYVVFGLYYAFDFLRTVQRVRDQDFERGQLAAQQRIDRQLQDILAKNQIHTDRLNTERELITRN